MVFGTAAIIVMVVVSGIVLFVVDRTQRRDAIRRNYPVIGRFRRLFSSLGEFFRQYFFAMDREEMPFNRAQREWVNRAAEGHINTVAFGSTRNLAVVGTPIFVNAPFPPLEEQHTIPGPLIIGQSAKFPFEAPSFFNISGMSYGAISAPAVRALSAGAQKAGIWLNTGEGGLSPFHLEGGCDIVFQIGTAKYGVCNDKGELDDKKLKEVGSHKSVRMFELKLAQGAKPGKGGILPAEKVSEEIAKIRGIPIGQASLSPNRHREIKSYCDLGKVIAHIREVTGKPVGIKIVVGSEADVRQMFETFANTASEMVPDFITLDGGEGGTGAAPMPLIDLVGVSIREALPLVVGVREEFGLQDRIRLIASGKLVNPGDVAWALAAGADFVTSARGFMFALGCIQALKCNKNTCPTGITTHDVRLQQGLDVGHKIERVFCYAKEIIHEVEVIAHSTGVLEPRDLRPQHVRLVLPDGRSAQMDRL
nr:FMN-binding glutamate synthase family protein [Shimia gijangensis]